MVVLNSPKAAFDLLDKRSSIYSDRPKSLVVELYVTLNSLDSEFALTIYADAIGLGGAGTPHCCRTMTSGGARAARQCSTSRQRRCRNTCQCYSKSRSGSCVYYMLSQIGFVSCCSCEWALMYVHCIHPLISYGAYQFFRSVDPEMHVRN